MVGNAAAQASIMVGHLFIFQFKSKNEMNNKHNFSLRLFEIFVSRGTITLLRLDRSKHNLVKESKR